MIHDSPGKIISFIRGGIPGGIISGLFLFGSSLHGQTLLIEFFAKFIGTLTIAAATGFLNVFIEEYKHRRKEKRKQKELEKQFRNNHQQKNTG